MSWKNYDFKCDECKGQGEVACGECGYEHECEECSGRGINPHQVDLEAFRLAEAEMAKKGEPNEGTWEIIENGKWVGRQNKSHKLYYANFLIAAAP